MRTDFTSFLKVIKPKQGAHNQQKVIWLEFPYNTEYIRFAKTIKARWSRTERCWYVLDNRYFRELFGLEKEIIAEGILSRISQANQPTLKKLVDELKLKAYSTSTIKTYVAEFAQLLYLLKEVQVDSLEYNQLRSYFLYCIDKLRISENQLHSRINAIKFYFENVLKRKRFTIEIPRPKKPSKLPVVLSKKDIQKIFSNIENLKHLLMLKLCYGMGLRVSEVVNLKITDIDSSRMLVHIRKAKGKKDRYVPLPESVLKLLREYYKKYRPKEFLFEGQYGGQYAVRSVQQVFRNSMKKAKINKKVGIHGLRHSYATHLFEYGTDMSFIQKLLGHNDIKTTLIYTKVSNAQLENIKSPLDRM